MPPYPLVKDLTANELEYLTQFLDHFQGRKSQDEGRTDMGEIVGYLKEFHEQQLSGKTDYVLPRV